MNISEIAAASAPALLVAVPHAIADITIAIRSLLAARRPSTTTPKEPMNDIAIQAPVLVPAPSVSTSIFDTIHAWAGRAVEAMTMVGTEWNAIKGNPLYGALATAAVGAAKAELASKGIPIDGVVNVEHAIFGMMEVLAAAHPVIVTPPAEPASAPA